MKRILTALFFLAVCISACNSSGSGSGVINDSARTKITLHSFSDTSKLDTFRISLKGDKPKEMELVFTITPESGTPVFMKIFKATDLLDNYKDNVDLGKKKKQVKFLQAELNLFFAEENFLEPAVTENEEADKNTPDKNFFAELKETGVNGFQFRTGKESKVYIAWSVSGQKVKPYYECCK